MAAIVAVGIPATLSGGTSTASVTGAINKLAPPATVSNATSTHVNFQGVILRVDLNYHFSLM